MDFNFTEEQEQLRDAVRKWVERGYTFERRRGIVDAGGFERSVWAEFAELGLTGLTIEEGDGGLGMGPIEAMIVLEELGRGLVLEPLEQAFISGRLLGHYGEGKLRSDWLARIASGDAVVVLAQQERQARYRLDRIETQAQPNGDDYLLSGHKSLVPAGDQADAWVVPARFDGGVALFLVEAGTDGALATGYLTQDGSRAAELQLRNTPARLITAHGEAALQEAVQLGIAAACASGVGTMDQTLALTADYLNQRKQFGVPIASFQSLRHRIADMKMQLELGRSMSYYAWLKLGESSPSERQLALSRAKYQLGQSMRFVGQQSVQLHGGIGVTDEYIGSHYFKRLTQLEILWGDSLHHLAVVSDNMQETAGVFA
ncbi:acyl-CoA dehydrogenase [Corticibacter populi]|uniref:Acyl-CoA dehydrogenase n=1 Tax=Corticibacter populi TaxID=1550736 RepID=A0A3M6QZ04_9BURK|nr:acyl-CoA dehydrogenase family protein [Corticibacter populi]RMX08123.1 acyl-CoA dehydrogenase [Corticibacter populi]RZS35375.1 hypothetical protein EV687_0439 [Corticibacter populi]